MYWLGYLFSIVFFATYGLLWMSALKDTLAENTLLSDMIILLFTQLFGIGITKHNFSNPFRNDPYTRKIRILNRLPVHGRAIATSRLWLVILLSIVNCVAFCLPAYLILPEVIEFQSVASFVTFVYLMILYSAVWSYFYTYLETGFTGRIYFLLSWLMMTLVLAIVVGVWLLDKSITYSVVRLTENGYAVLLISVISALLIWMTQRAIIRRLEKRDYYK